jgi:hypothetical protein
MIRAQFFGTRSNRHSERSEVLRAIARLLRGESAFLNSGKQCER